MKVQSIYIVEVCNRYSNQSKGLDSEYITYLIYGHHGYTSSLVTAKTYDIVNPIAVHKNIRIGSQQRTDLIFL